MKRAPSILLGLLGAVLLAGASPAGAQMTLRATITPPRIQVGERALLQVEFSGAQDVPAPDIQTPDGIELRYAGPSTQVSIVNGRMSASVQHRYALTATQPGRYTLGPFAVDHQGQSYRAEAVVIEVAAAGAAPPGGVAGKPLRLTVSSPKSELFVNEIVPLDVYLYIGQIRVDLQQFPALHVDGANVEKFPQPTQQQTVIDGQQYTVVHFQTKLTPVRDGPLTIGPVTMDITTFDRRRGSLFNDPFFSEGQVVTLRSEPLVLNVLPLPKEGKPAGYGGAVGNFALETTASPTELNAGDPVTLRIVLTGRGNLDNVPAPALASTAGFRIYDAKPTTTNEGLRIYEQVLIPNDASVKQVPEVHFSYFDTEQRQYQTLRTAPIALNVRAAQLPQQSQILAAQPVEKEALPEELGRDIIFIKDDPGSLAARGSTPWQGALFWILPVLAPLGFVAARVYDQRRSLLLGDARFARFTRAGKAARAAIATAEAQLRSGDRSGFLDAIAHATHAYLAAKLDLPVGGIDADSVAACGVAAQVVEQLRLLDDTCERLRFAPGDRSGDLEALVSAARQIVDTLERERRWGGKIAAMALGAIYLAGTGAAWAAEPASPQTSFFQANALYKQGQFAAAANEYEQVLGAGVESAALYFNLGNAHFKAGDRGRAILNYERALRLAPGDPDVQANLSYARSLAGSEECSTPLWRTAVAPLSGRMSLSALAWTMAILWTLGFAVLAAWRLVPQHPRALLWAVLPISLGWLVATTSLVSEAWRNAPRNTAVIIASGTTAARFEPAASGTEHYPLKQGAVVRIVERRDGWWQVARCDGRRGWVDGNNIAALAD